MTFLISTRSLARASASALALTVGLYLTTTFAAGDELPVDFDREIRPVLSANCYSCHGPDEESRKADLRLDVPAVAFREADGVRPIAPGNPSGSEVIRRITSTDPDEVMPPVKTGRKLSAREIERLRLWIKQGAEYTTHWSFVPPRRAALPTVQDSSWPRNAIDLFVLRELEAQGLSPSSPADPHLLIRRLSLDLRGVPPTPEEVAEFISDPSADAYRKLIDRYLASPAFGERWAIVWLDLARYADSAGYGSDPLRPNLWPWREWVIDALNRNQPFDEFTRDQIAGDLVPDPTRDQLVATAFHRNTMTNTEGGTDDEEFRIAAVKDRANTTAQVWMGLTMGCAQCHSHKFDPITHREYYQFFAFFNQTEDNDQPDERPTLPLPTPAQQARMDDLQRQIEELEQRLNQATPEFEAELREWEEAHSRKGAWTIFRPDQVQSQQGANLEVLEDGSIRASGPSPSEDTYVLKFRLGRTPITALRLEMLRDPAFPGDGPGRAGEDGGFTLSELEAAVRSSDVQRPVARFVRVELPGVRRILALAEVEVWDGRTNRALDGTASQSSTGSDAPAGRAIDGDRDGDFTKDSVSSTAPEDNPWWEVDLGAEIPLEEIVVWNRMDRGLGTRLAEFKISALNVEREVVWEKKGNAAPLPVAAFRVPPEKSIPLQNASATSSKSGFSVDRAIDGKRDSKSGWAVGETTEATMAASFELKESLQEPEAVLILSLVQNYGTNHTLGRFRISATGRPVPVRETPNPIRRIMAIPRSERDEEQADELAEYFREFAPSLRPLHDQLATVRKQLKEVDPVALPVMRELAEEKRRSTHILSKGNFLAPEEEVAPGVPAAFHPWPEDAPTNRVGLAEWLTSPANPLTARVTVNRLWARLLGRGIVQTEEDFGTQGALPSHPELLDWLAVEFVENSWDVKRLLQWIVSSATYQQSSRVDPNRLERDPANRLYSRGPRHRLGAEIVRDQALALSGLLSRKIGGPSVYPIQPEGLWRAAFNGQRNWPTSEGEDRYRRGLYTFWRRTVPYPSMATFDAPSRETCTVRRIQTNTPLQAFVTLNDPAFVEAAQALGRRIHQEGGATVRDRVRWGLELCLARPASERQVRVLVNLYEQELAHYRAREADAMQWATEPLGPLPEGFAVEEAAAWTSVANVLLNLDAVLTKG